MNYKNQKVMKLSNENQMMFNIVPLFGAPKQQPNLLISNELGFSFCQAARLCQFFQRLQPNNCIFSLDMWKLFATFAKWKGFPLRGMELQLL